MPSRILQAKFEHVNSEIGTLDLRSPSYKPASPDPTVFTVHRYSPAEAQAAVDWTPRWSEHLALLVRGARLRVCRQHRFGCLFGERRTRYPTMVHRIPQRQVYVDLLVLLVCR